MKVKINGTNKIGGCITEIISDNETCILIDYGKDLNNEDSSLKSDINWNNVDAVFITHIHDDHIGLINDVPVDIPIYVEEHSFAMFNISKAFTKDKKVRKVNTFKIGDVIGKEIGNGDITVTSFINDHSAFNSVMYLVECDNKRLLHMGDFRTNGRKGILLKKTLEKINYVDALIMEGTTLSRDNTVNKTENILCKKIKNAIKDYDNVLILQSSTNIDRIVTMYLALRDTEKIFIQDICTANITTYLSSLNYNIPNPKTFNDVYSFVPKSRDEYKRKIKSEFYNKYIKDFTRDAHNLMAYKKYGITIKTSMLKDIKMYYDKGFLKKTCLIYSMWDGYKDELYMKEFLDKIKDFRIEILDFHTSGHADEKARDLVLSTLKYKYLLPIHTDRKEKYSKYKNAYIIEDNQYFTIN